MHQGGFRGAQHRVDLPDVLSIPVHKDAAKGRGRSCKGHQKAPFVALTLYAPIEHTITSGSARFRGAFQGAGGRDPRERRLKAAANRQSTPMAAPGPGMPLLSSSVVLAGSG